MKKKITITAMSLLTALFYSQLMGSPIRSTMNLIWAQMKVAHK